MLHLDLRASIETLLPRSSFITVKDGRLLDGKPQFLLPGDGTIDYAQYFALLKTKAFRGWMLVEISRPPDSTLLARLGELIKTSLPGCGRRVCANKWK